MKHELGFGSGNFDQKLSTSRAASSKIIEAQRMIKSVEIYP